MRINRMRWFEMHAFLSDDWRVVILWSRNSAAIAPQFCAGPANKVNQQKTCKKPGNKNDETNNNNKIVCVVVV